MRVGARLFALCNYTPLPDAALQQAVEAIQAADWSAFGFEIEVRSVTPQTEILLCTSWPADSSHLQAAEVGRTPELKLGGSADPLVSSITAVVLHFQHLPKQKPGRRKQPPPMSSATQVIEKKLGGNKDCRAHLVGPLA